MEPGTKYGDWTVIGPETPRAIRLRSHVKCLCGQVGLIRNTRLRTGESTRCAQCSRRYEVVTYKGAHKRVKRDKGEARHQKCFACGEDADHWAYQHNDPNELRDLANRPYSTDPSKYVAMCASCHKEYDLDYLVNVDK